MATWEQKMPSLVQDMWSIKATNSSNLCNTSAAAATVSPQSHLFSRSFLPALTASEQHHLPAVNYPVKLEGMRFISGSRELPNAVTATATGETGSTTILHSSRYDRDSHDSCYERLRKTASAGGTMVATGLGGTDAADSHCVATTTGNNSKMLNASASLGGAASKVTKKRARASRRPPTTVLEADSANFRSMVQQLTGIPSVSFLSSPSSMQRSGIDFLDLVRPHHTARPLVHPFAPQVPSLQGLPPLDAAVLLNFGNAPSHVGGGISQRLHNPPNTSAFAPPFLREMYNSGDRLRPASMGDFLRTPLEELGGLNHNSNNPAQFLNTIDHHQQQHQIFSTKLEASGACLSMPLLWDAARAPTAAASTTRELSKNHPGELTKYDKTVKSPKGESSPAVAVGEEVDQEGSSKMSQIVDSWLSHADQNTEKLAQ